MIRLKKAVSSSIGQKFVMAVTGLLLIGFLITHLLANLLLFKHDGIAFNTYANTLTGLGYAKLGAEIGLLVLFVGHIFLGLGLKKKNYSARGGQRYRVWRSKKGDNPDFVPSNTSSRSMWISGLVLLTFLVIHIKQFTLGPAEAAGYLTQLNGHNARDLHRLVVEIFQSPLWVGFYVAVMIFLGMHLRHGFWSAFQSLGANYPRISGGVQKAGIGLALVMAAGFIGIPIWIYFTGAGP